MVDQAMVIFSLDEQRYALPLDRVQRSIGQSHDLLVRIQCPELITRFVRGVGIAYDYFSIEGCLEPEKAAFNQRGGNKRGRRHGRGDINSRFFHDKMILPIHSVPEHNTPIDLELANLAPCRQILLRNTFMDTSVVEMDFSIEVAKFPPTHTGPYVGTMTLSASAVEHLVCES